ncbi:Pyocin-S2 [Grimontia marina]|uniref:Pyocin-S2 n=2 Tax=Grimontia marina TaxID=646534 RepID=A0A128FKZ4_9GAMM|nr:Pyocin-S2 [Grimontia marina]
MSLRVVKATDLMAYEFGKVEGGFQQMSARDLERVLPDGMAIDVFKNKLYDGQLVLLNDAPNVPALQAQKGTMGNTTWRVNPEASNHLSPQAQQAMVSRTKVQGAPASSGGSLNPPLPQPHYTPEAVVADPPPEPIAPTKISENFGKPAQADKVFAKSCTRPYGDTQACEEALKAPNFGMMAAMVPAQALDASGRLPLTKLTGNTTRMPLNWGLTGEIAKSAAKRANFLALAFWPSQLGDGTLYTDEELAQLPEAATRVRFRLYQDEHGNPQAIGIHTGEGNPYGDTVRRISAEAVEDRFEAKVDEEITLTWFPDDSDKVLTAGTSFPDTSGLEISNILVRPIEDDGQELTTLVYPNPEAEHIELIVTFPADSGIPPLYLVFSSPRNKPGGVTGQGEDITGIWLESAGKDLGSPIPSQIADKMRGREFSSFDKFREAFWKEVYADEELRSQFRPGNQGNLKKGRAPKAVPSEWHFEKASFELHHVKEIQHGGAVYDVDNIRIVTPKNHNRIHYG